MPKIKLQDVKTAISIGREVLPFVQPVIIKHGPEVADQVTKKARQASDAVEDARSSMFNKLQQRKDNKEQQKLLDEARKKAVASPLPPISADEFFKTFEANVDDSGNLTEGYMAITGCYAILTLKSTREKDLSAFKDVYVGCSRKVGFDIYSQLRGLGNPDVYADFKFKAPMKILVYPYEESDLENRYTRLIEDLQAIDSYNKWDLINATTAND